MLRFDPGNFCLPVPPPFTPCPSNNVTSSCMYYKTFKSGQQRIWISFWFLFVTLGLFHWKQFEIILPTTINGYFSFWLPKQGQKRPVGVWVVCIPAPSSIPISHNWIQLFLYIMYSPDLPFSKGKLSKRIENRKANQLNHFETRRAGAHHSLCKDLYCAEMPH